MRTALFVTCLTDTLFPAAGRAVVELLTRLGHDVAFPLEQTCCGQMHINAGYREEAVPLVQRFVDVFGSDRFDAVVSPSGSCVAAVKHQYPRLAAEDPPLAAALEALLPRVHELSEFLVDELGVEDVGARFPHRVTFHPSCHGLRSLGGDRAPLALLRAVRDIDLVELPDADACCGFGGLFSIKSPETSAAMLTDKLVAIKQTGAEVCTAVDSSCLMHIGGACSRTRSGVRVAHIAEILAAADGAASVG